MVEIREPKKGRGVPKETPGENSIAEKETSLPKSTLCIPVRGNPPTEILLGHKKTGFGAGKVTGFGGKVEAAETAIQAAARELEEETGLRACEKGLQPVGLLRFLFPAKPAWSQEVHVYLVRNWEGRPREGREMAPAWYAVDALPIERMWQDGAHWLPPILAGERIQGTFRFQRDNETIEGLEINQWPTLLA